MVTKVQKWGNSLAVRIPRALAEDARLRPGGAVALAVDEGRIVITPARRVSYRLADLLKVVTARNCHGEVDSGAAVGREVW